MSDGARSRWRRLRHALRGGSGETLCVLLVILFSAGAGYSFLFQQRGIIGSEPGTVPGDLASAVMIALGHGLCPPPDHPAIEAFLLQETVALDPVEVADIVVNRRPDVWSLCHQYLLGFLGFIWRFLGIDWHAYKLAPFLLYLVSAPLAYGVFRLGMGRLISLAATALFMTTPVLLQTLLSLRDFSKAPFILAVLLILGRLLKRPVSSWGLVGGGALLGILLGFGYGFRADLLVFMPLCVPILLFATTGRTRRLLPRAGAVLALAAGFAAAAFPILNEVRQEEGAQVFHDLMMGWSSDCLQAATVRHPSYEVQYAYYDDASYALRCAHQRYYRGDINPVDWWNRRDALAARNYLLAHAALFPADWATRGLAAVRAGLGDTALLSGTDRPHEPFLVAMGRFRAPLARHLELLGPFYAAAFLFLVAWRDLKRAWLLFFLILYVCGYTSLQYHPRHVFHLALLAPWCLGFLVDKGGRGLCLAGRSLLKREQRCKVTFPGREHWRRVGRIGACAFCAALLVALPYGLLLLAQRHAVRGLLHTYTQAEVRPVQTRESEDGQWVQIDFLDWRNDRAEARLVEKAARERGVSGEAMPMAHYLDRLFAGSMPRAVYLAVDFDGTSMQYPLHIRYDTGAGYIPFDRILTVDRPGVPKGKTRYFFPVFDMWMPVERRFARFRGIRLPKACAGEFRGACVVEDITRFPLLLNLGIPEERAAFEWRMRVGQRAPVIP